MWVTSLGLAGEAGIFASLPFYPMFSGVPNGLLRLSPPQVHAAVHNSGVRAAQSPNWPTPPPLACFKFRFVSSPLVGGVDDNAAAAESGCVVAKLVLT